MYTLSLADRKGLGARGEVADLSPRKIQTKYSKVIAVLDPPTTHTHRQSLMAKKIITRIPSPLPGKFMDQSSIQMIFLNLTHVRTAAYCKGMFIKNEKKLS